MQQLTSFITSELNKRDWSMREVARRSNLSSALVSGVLGGRMPPSADFCIAIATSLGADPVHLLKLAKHLPPTIEEKRKQDPIFDELITIYTSLPPHLKESAILMLRGLCGPPLYIDPTTAQRISSDLSLKPENALQIATTKEVEKESDKGGQQSKDNIARQAYSRFFDNYPLEEVEQASQHLIALLQEVIEKQQAIEQGERSGA